MTFKNLSWLMTSFQDTRGFNDYSNIAALDPINNSSALILYNSWLIDDRSIGDEAEHAESSSRLHHQAEERAPEGEEVLAQDDRHLVGSSTNQRSPGC